MESFGEFLQSLSGDFRRLSSVELCAEEVVINRSNAANHEPIVRQETPVKENMYLKCPKQGAFLVHTYLVGVVVILAQFTASWSSERQDSVGGDRFLGLFLNKERFVARHLVVTMNRL